MRLKRKVGHAHILYTDFCYSNQSVYHCVLDNCVIIDSQP